MSPDPGPATRLIWERAPRLPPVTMGDLDGGPAEAAAIGVRRLEGWPCCLCGEPAVAALVARPRTGPFRAPVWADLCPGCWGDVLRENPG